MRQVRGRAQLGIRSLRGFRLEGVGTSHSQIRQCSGPAVPDDPAVVENLLKLDGGSTALSCCQVRLSVYMRRIDEEGNTVGE
jgi:hypothetical protein